MSCGVWRTYPFEHVSTGMGAVSVQVEGLCLCLNPESLGCVDVDVETGAMGALQAKGLEFGFFWAELFLWFLE